MPLNREAGEIIGDLGPAFRVAPPSKWRELENVKTEFDIIREGKWPQKAKRSIYRDAITHARDAFHKEGALWPVKIDDSGILVQEYPMLGKVAFIFCRVVAGAERFVTRVYDLSPDVIAWLSATDRWPRTN